MERGEVPSPTFHDGFQVRESIEAFSAAKLGVSAQADSTEWVMDIGELETAVIDVHASGGGLIDDSLLICGEEWAEIVEGQRFWSFIDEFDDFGDVLECKDWENRSEDFLLHDFAVFLR